MRTEKELWAEAKRQMKEEYNPKIKTEEELIVEAKRQLTEELDQRNKRIEKQIIEQLKAKLEIEKLWNQYDLNEDQLNMVKLWVSAIRSTRSKLPHESEMTEEQSSIIDYGAYKYRLEYKQIPPIDEQINNHPDDYEYIERKKGIRFIKKSELKLEPEPEPEPKRKGFFAWLLWE